MLRQPRRGYGPGRVNAQGIPGCSLAPAKGTRRAKLRLNAMQAIHGHNRELSDAVSAWADRLRWADRMG